MPGTPGTAVEVDNTVRVLTEDLDGGTLAGGGVGPVTNYDADPGDGTWKAAPNVGAEDTYTPPFRVTQITLLVRSFSIEVQFAFDDVPTYGDWIILEPGAFAFEGWSPTSVQIREETDDAGAEYQIVAEA